MAQEGAWGGGRCEETVSALARCVVGFDKKTHVTHGFKTGSLV